MFAQASGNGIKHLSAACIAAMTTLSMTQNVSAAEPLDCVPQWITPPQAVPPAQPDNRPTELEADALIQPQAQHYTLSGDALIKQPGLVIMGDEIHYDQARQKAQAFGKVAFHREDLIVTADYAEVDEPNQTAHLEHSRYQIKPSRAHGHAKQIDLNKVQQQVLLKQASFTTCPVENLSQQPLSEQAGDTRLTLDEKLAWELRFSDLEINDRTRRVYGKHTRLYFHGVPVLYTPYFDFPLDDRASGLLVPEFGGYKSITEDQSSFYVKLPYYFNIAPNIDDTLTLMYMENRGPVLENEFRYLQQTGQVRHSAELTLTGLNDAKTADEGLASLQGDEVVYGEPVEQRWRAKLQANQSWGHGLSSHLLWHEVSDEHFFADIPVESQLKTATYTPRHVTVNYRQQNFQAYAQLYSYLRLRETDIYNYEKRPEIGLLYNESFGNLHFDLATEATEFDIPLSGHTKPEALRTRLAPALSYALHQPYGHLKASVVANHLNYAVHHNAATDSGEADYQHTVMQYALKGGLVFERDFSIGQRGFIQTLEPELQYLHVPYVDQSDIPLFDTGAKSLHFSNLFGFNRFSGFDRIGDTSQVTAALTSKVLTQAGAPFLEAGIGQIFYLQDRKVTLYNTPTETLEQSDYFVKLGASSERLHFYSTSQFSRDDTELVNANSRLRLNLGRDSKLLLNHTLTNNNLPNAQATLAAGATVRLSPRWEIGTYWNYDFTQEVRNEVQYALRYDDCCWATELSLEEAQLENGLYNYSVQFLVEFKGLSSTGTSFKRYLDDKLSF